MNDETLLLIATGSAYLSAAAWHANVTSDRQRRMTVPISVLCGVASAVISSMIDAGVSAEAVWRGVVAGFTATGVNQLWRTTVKGRLSEVVHAEAADLPDPGPLPPDSGDA